MPPAPAPGANGVLPVPAAVLQKGNQSKDQPAAAAKKAAAPKLKLVLRRLAPSLTLAELEASLGEEWKCGNGKVDWFEYRPGKASKNPSKPSHPSRAYFHLTDSSHLESLSNKVRETHFHDAKNTFKDPVLIGPPDLVFDPFTTVPSSKRRNDSRMGTIDQDPEFIQFLESLTNPVPKATTAPSSEPVEHKEDEKVTTTPLIEAIREAKANKQSKKEAKAAKHSRQESKDTAKAEKVGDKKILSKGAKETESSSNKKARASRAEKAAAKEAAKTSAKEDASSASTTTTKSASQAETLASTERRRDRGNSGIAAKIQRDLGIIPGASNRAKSSKKEKDSANAENKHAEDAAKPSTDSASASAADKSAGKSGKKEGKPSRSERRKAAAATAASKSTVDAASEPSKTTDKAQPKAPTILKKPNSNASPEQSEAVKAVSTGPNAPCTPNVSGDLESVVNDQSPPRQAFLKHANASQGITEPLLTEAMSAFGVVTSVEIDKRKGFAYVDFAEAEALRAAIAASPVKVAQGTVQVLERKERSSKGGANAPVAGGSGGGRGRGRGKFSKGGGPKGGPNASATPATNQSSGAG